jgi:uncharacterized protein (DUF3084 family)
MEPLNQYLAQENGALTRKLEDQEKQIRNLQEECQNQYYVIEHQERQIEDAEAYIEYLEHICTQTDRRRIPVRLLRLTAYNFRYRHGSMQDPIDLTSDSESD